MSRAEATIEAVLAIHSLFDPTLGDQSVAVSILGDGKSLQLKLACDVGFGPA